MVNTAAAAHHVHTTPQQAHRPHKRARGPSHVLQGRSLGILTSTNPIRLGAHRLVSNKWFNHVILVAIVLNTVLLGMADYSFVTKDYMLDPTRSWRNALIKTTDPIFLVLFALEMAAKIVAYGLFCNGRASYFKDGWNWLDFVVVCGGTIEVMSIDVLKVSFLRTLRVLRPLRTMSHFQGMRVLVGALLGSASALANVVLLLLVVFLVFGITGVQQWGIGGAQYRRCRLTEFPVKIPLDKTFPFVHSQLTRNSTRCLGHANDSPHWKKSTSPWSTPQDCVWPIDSHITRLCGNFGYHCPKGTWCGSNYDSHGNPRFRDVRIMEEPVFAADFNWGFTSFDNIAAAVLTLFQAVTMEGWVDIMYMVMDGYNYTMASFFFVILLFIGAFFMLNLTLAVIWEKFENAQSSESEKDQVSHHEHDSPTSVYFIADWGAWHVPSIGIIVRSRLFDNVILQGIVFNTVVLSMVKYPSDDEWDTTLELVNFVLTVVFFFEMIFRMIGLGLREYFSDSFRTFDMIIVCASISEILMSPPVFLGGSSSASGGAITVLRTFRLFRVLKVMTSIPSLRRLLTAILATIVDVANFAVLLILFMYIFALLGMQLLANRLHFDKQGYPIQLTSNLYVDVACPVLDSTVACNEIPRSNYDSFMVAFTTVFQALSGEDWNVLMYDARRAQGTAGVLFLLTVICFGDFMVMNLFLAVLLGGFSDPEESAESVGCGEESSEANKADDKTELLRVSCGCIRADNSIRKKIITLVYDERFDNAVLFLIVLSSFTLAIDNPLLDPESNLRAWLHGFDVVITIIFLIEMLLKIVAMGLICHQGAYLRSGWNQLDCFIVVVACLGLISESVTTTGGMAVAFRSLRSLRCLRALRPLRMISRNPGMKLVVNALFQAIPGVANVVALCFLFFLIFAIVFVNFFKGSFNHCTGHKWDNLTVGQKQLVTSPEHYDQLNEHQQQWKAGSYDGATSKSVCLWLAGDEAWQATRPQNFDNVPNAMLTLFEMSTTEGWVGIMYSTVDSTGIDMQPKRDNAPLWAILSMMFIVVGAYFVVNLFVGVIIDNFERLKQANDGSSVLLTPAQQHWLEARKMMMRLSPALCMKPPQGRIRRALYNVVQEDGPKQAVFETLIIVCILLNTAVMACVYFGQSDEWADAVENLNIIFAFVFFIEMIIKVLAMGFFAYWSDSWNRFDFLIVATSVGGLVFQKVFGSNFGQWGTVFRTLRVGRIIRLMKSLSGLRTLFNAVLLTLPGLFNVSVLLLLMYFIFAVMGMQLFATVKLRDNLSEHANFQTFSNSLLTLIRCSTGEFWNGIMHDLANTDDCSVSVSFNATICGYNDFDGCIPIDGCGGKVAYLYFFAFSLFVMFVFVNLFVGVVIDGFEESVQAEVMNKSGEVALSNHEWRQFCKEWVLIDRKLEYVLDEASVDRLLNRLHFLRSDESGIVGESPAVFREVFQLQVDPRTGKFCFEDVALAIGKYACHIKFGDNYDSDERTNDPFQGVNHAWERRKKYHQKRYERKYHKNANAADFQRKQISSEEAVEDSATSAISLSNNKVVV